MFATERARSITGTSSGLVASPMRSGFHLHRCTLQLAASCNLQAYRATTPACRALSTTAHERADLAGSDASLEVVQDLGTGYEDHRGQAQGRLDLVVGPMFAGKTTRLISLMKQLQPGTRAVAVKSDKDTRYGASTQYLPTAQPNGHLYTHYGLRQDCYAVPALEFLRRLEGFRDLQVIFIDEGHFFTDLREFCNRAVDEDGKHVIVAGLDSDFERNAIGQLAELFPRADRVIKLTAQCAGEGGACAHPATFTWRTAGARQQELVGGSEAYQALCRHHYLQASRQLQQQS